MNTDLLIIVALCFSLLGLGLLWLALEQRKLKKVNQVLTEQIDSMTKDIAGLCLAAVKVDSRIANSAEQLADLLDKLGDYEQKESEVSPYHSVIQRVRAGASAQELIKDCGLSREEAALLIKVHGSRSN
ncbi:MAG: DUF2802 domain-containing protein [Methylococcaceae bacterium]|nr:DUF2802 domain-containing protein [Methylococcaceae bacterium]